MEYFLQRLPDKQDLEGPFNASLVKLSLEKQKIGDQWRVCWGNGSWMLAGDFLKLGPLGASETLPRTEKNTNSALQIASGSINGNSGVDHKKEFCIGDEFGKSHSAKLGKLIELQEKQLFWIRFFGVITVISMVFAFFYVILVMNSGYRRY